MRTFTAILLSFFLLNACDPEAINENECKTDHFDLLEQHWSLQLDPYFQYQNSKWFEMGDYVGLINNSRVVSMIHKKTGQISGNTIMPYFYDDHLHIYNNKLYY